jgi:hypothetical protein
MIAKKLLNHVQVHLDSMGYDGVKELQYVHIPGLANPLDRRCGRGNMKSNAVAYRRALAMESKSIMAWVAAFNTCRSHYNQSLSPSGGGKAGGGRGGRGAATAVDDSVDPGADLDEIRTASRAAAADNEFVDRIEYYLPCIARPIITTEDLGDINDDSVEYDTGVLAVYPHGVTHVSHGFQEASITLVARPVVSEDFFLDFQRGYDIGSFPPLVRIVLLDFVIGCSDPDVAECVLSDADSISLTTLRRQQRFYSVQSNCMDNYVRQDVYSAWNAGFQKHQQEMASKYSLPSAGNEPWQVTKLLMEKTNFYAQQAIQFHCSNIADGVYRSEITTHVFEVYKQLKGELHSRLKKNITSWGPSNRPAEWNSIDNTSQMRLLFYRGLQEFNQDAKMSYTNIAIVTELFTTMIQWFIHPGNATWSCWLIPLQVVPQKAQLYRAYNKDNNKSICVDKPNSTGVDEVACRSFDGMMGLCNGEVTRSDGRALDLKMCKAGRETPVARERRNKVMVCNNKVAAEPDPSLVNRMQSSTEERNLGDADLDAKIRVTPRNRTTIRDGTVFTTDTNDKGTREAQRWEPVGGYNPGLQATNCQINNLRNQEQWETLLVATKCMSTGRDTERKRKRAHRGDFTVNHASGSSQGVRDVGKCKDLSTLLCVLPHFTGTFIGFMNKLGFTNMEISPLTQMYMDYLYWRFDSLFSRFIGVRLSKSFQRTCQGHYGRHIADFTMARLTLEVSKEEDFDKALANTLNVVSYNCLPLGAVPGWMDDSMREGVDGQLLVLHTVVSSILDVPHVSLSWLCKALQPYDTLSDDDRSYVDNHEDAMKLAKWVKFLVDNDMFVYEQNVTVFGGGQGASSSADGPIRVERTGDKRVYPYISTSCNATEDNNFLRTNTKNRGFSEEIAKKIVKHPEMMNYSKNTGFTCDDKVVKCMVDRTTHMSLGLSDAFGTYDLCNPSTIFAIAHRKLGDFAVVSPISESVLSNSAAMLDPTYAMLQTTSVHDTTEVMFGVNMTLAVVMTSLLEGSNVANSQVDERLTRSIMWLMMRDVPKQFSGQDGTRYLRKNFRGNNPSCDFNKLDGYNEPRPAYILRPTHDHEKEFNRLTHFACNIYCGYAPEDCVHMSELAALTKTYAAKSVLNISVSVVVPRYMFMFETRYAVSFTREGMALEQTRLGHSLDNLVRGHLTISAPKSVKSGSVPAHTTSWTIRFYGDEHSSEHNIHGTDVCDIDQALAARNAVVLPLIQRHNAVVYSTTTQKFGVIQPLQVGPRASFHKDTYFDVSEDVWGYRVVMENTCLDEPTSINAVALESGIVALASTIWIRGDVYTLCGSKSGRHCDAPRVTSGNRNHNSPYCHYIPAVISYPGVYPTKTSQLYSLFVEVAYAGRSDTEQTRYEMMEINLELLREQGLYTAHETHTPLSHCDPRITFGDEIAVVSFTSNGYF